MHALANSVKNYLNEILGINPTPYTPWDGKEKIPYFLQDYFDFWELELLGRPILLALERGEHKETIGEIRTRMNKLQSLTDLPTVYVTNALTSSERKRLIEQNIPFIVPGNQLYFPELGMDLREYFRQRQPSTVESISPSAQALLITALLNPIWEVEWQPTEIIARLGYTPMTRTRAIRELVTARIVQKEKVGRTNILKFVLSPKNTWELAKPFLRSPVKHSFWVMPNSVMLNMPKLKAGISALADYSMITEPKWPEYAVSLQDWNSFWPRPEILPEPIPGACKWEVWSYNPALLPHSDTVDLYSLTLSLQNNTDERIQMAVDELKGQLPW